MGQGWARGGPGVGQGWARGGPGVGQGGARGGPGVGQGWARGGADGFILHTVDSSPQDNVGVGLTD